MPLNPGARLGPYEILAPLGAGGMGEVYRARDTTLNRDVAIKILPQLFASDADRLARFTREAQTLAALNHPNIAQIFGLEDFRATGSHVRALVMELVSGEDLSERLARGPLTLQEALPIARQIADGLEAAHEQGIVHRDLKPANIKLRGDGTVKVLDFGLAKGMASAAGASGDAPTIQSPAATEAGVLLGTAAYMSPEQARGAPVDRRADIWAFGAVVYEMLSGRRLFDGQTASDLVAAVLRDRIDWSALPADTPPPLRRLVERCLDRDLKQRLQAIGEARVALDDTMAQRPGGTVAGPGPGRSSGVGASRRLAAAVVGLAIVGALALWLRGRTTPTTSEVAPRAGRSLAVLPFVNTGGNQDDEYFADGMTDELIASLGKVPNLHVAARSSAFSFKGQRTEIKEVARKLGVDSILEGTIRRSGKRVRVTASLVSAADGLQIWSSTFENDGSDPFAVQDEVTRGVVAGLSLQLAGIGLQASQAGRTRDPEAHDLYLRGLASAKSASEPDLRRALQYYQQALARDPGFALAYAGIGWVHVFLADAYVAPSEAYPQAKIAAQAALERDNRLADGHSLLAFSTFAEWREPAAYEPGFTRALDLDPNSVNTLMLEGVAWCFTDKIDQGLADLERAAVLDPLSPLAPMMQEVCNYAGKRYRAAIEAHQRTRAIDPSFAYGESWSGAAYRELGDYAAALREYGLAERPLNGAPQSGLALTYFRMGREADARIVMRQMDERAATRYVPFIARAVVHAALGDRNTGVELLRQAADHRENFLLGLRRTPDMAPLLDDPRARQILDRVDAMLKGK